MVPHFPCASLPAFSQPPQDGGALLSPLHRSGCWSAERSCSRSSAAKKQNQYFKLSLSGFKASCFFYYNVPLLYETIPTSPQPLLPV